MSSHASLTEADIEVRSVQLEIMKQRVSDCEERVNSALENIDFVITDNNLMVQCPLDSRHYVPIAKEQKHLETCKYGKKGIGTEDIKEFGSRSGAKGLVLIPNSLETEILSRVRGKASDRTDVIQGIVEERESQDQASLAAQLKESLHYSYEALQQTHTPQERAALYDYVIMSNKRAAPETSAGIPDPFERLKTTENQGETELGIRDKLNKLRDAKRRRKSYKGGKGIHLKSLREETKSLIDLYMSNFCAEETSSESESKEKGRKRGKREGEEGRKRKSKHEYNKLKLHRKKS